MKNILAVGAHFDDIELGCAGTLMRHVDNGDNVFLCVVTCSGYMDNSGHVRKALEAQKEGFLAANKIGVKKIFTLDFPTLKLVANDELIFAIDKVVREIEPYIIYMPSENDVNLDHVATSKAVQACTKYFQRILAYKPNIYTSYTPFNPTCFVDISSNFEEKINIIKLFDSEKEKLGSWIDKITCKDKLNGAIAGCEYAEAFEIIKFVI